MVLAIGIAASVLSILVAAVMSAEEAASTLLSHGRVLRLAESERRGARVLLELLSEPHRLRAVTALSAGLAYVVVATSAMWIVANSMSAAFGGAALIGGLVAVVTVFSLAQVLPRTLAVQNPEGVALSFARPASRVVSVLRVPATALESPWRWVMRLVMGERAAHSAWLTETDHRSGASDDHQSVREVAEETLLEAVSDFTEKVVREVMVPRTDMTCLPDTATVEEAVEIIARYGYSRLPVYHETLDDIRGVVYAKDILASILRDPQALPVTFARRPYFVPETKPIQQLLVEMRERTHIAIVADEYGGTAGLVTIEDLLEEIVGEIQDEYDLEMPLVMPNGNGRYIVDARLPVGDLNELFGTAIESESDTVGGVVIEAAGRIPQVGDEVTIEGLTLRVTDVQGARIRQLLVESTGPNNDEEVHDA